jgi:hypothetical protein
MLNKIKGVGADVESNESRLDSLEPIYVPKPFGEVKVPPHVKQDGVIYRIQNK